jgi:FAD/FMN-containing dehydrogenase
MSQLTDIQGEVIYPGQDGYAEAARTPFAAGKPEIIVRPADATAVTAALAHAGRAGLPVTVRSGGHSMAGLSTDEKGMIIDLAHLNEVTIIDASRRLVRVGGGATWGQVATALAPHGLGITAGDTRQVGVGGATLGGGVGWMVRRWGLTIDSLVGAELVTADGRQLVAGPDQHAELFWALRGGGGNFGVVTGFEFMAQPVTSVHFGPIRYQAEGVAAVIAGWHELMRDADENLTTTLNLVPPFMGQPASVVLHCCYATAETQAAERALAPFRRLAPVAADNITIQPYPQILWDAMPLPPGMHFESHDILARDLGPDLTQATADLFRTGRTLIGLRSLGGAMARVPADSTAFAHRDASVMIVAGMGTPPGAPPGFLSEALTAWDAVAGYGTGTYMGFLSSVSDVDAAAAYPPDTYRRLAAVKREYDPDNTFHHSYNIML